MLTNAKLVWLDEKSGECPVSGTLGIQGTTWCTGVVNTLEGTWSISLGLLSQSFRAVALSRAASPLLHC